MDSGAAFCYSVGVVCDPPRPGDLDEAVPPRARRDSRSTVGGLTVPAQPVGYSKRSRLDKLGVKPGARVAVLGLVDPGFVAELQTRAADIATTRVTGDTDMVFVVIEGAAGLKRLATVEKRMRRDAAVWAIWPKGQPHVREQDVRDAALALGMVDIKVIAFDERLSALKLVVRVANR